MIYNVHGQDMSMSMVDPREQGGGRERLEFRGRTKIPGFKRWGPVEDRFAPPSP